MSPHRSIPKEACRCARSLWVQLAVLAFTHLAVAQAALAAPTRIEHAAFSGSGGTHWRVDVTLRHPDTGWDHYANLWVVETPDGRELGRRELLHPHEDEQPFTRSTTLEIPAGLTRVVVRAGCTVDGLNSAPLTVDLTQRQGPGYTVRK